MRKRNMAACFAALMLSLCAAGALAEGKLELPASIKVIEAQAFAGTSATEVVLPEGVQEIGSGAFEGSAVTQINLPASITTIAEDAFKDTPDGLVAVAAEGSYAYNRCEELEVKVEPDLTASQVDSYSYSIRTDGAGEQYAVITGYEGPTGVNLVIPERIDGLPVREIGDGAFEDRSDLTGSLTIPGSVRRIGEFAFDNCYGLTGDLTIQPGVEIIGDFAFSNCNHMTGTLRIPASVTEIGNNAFRDCHFSKVIDESGLYPRMEAGNGYFYARRGTDDDPYAVITGYDGDAYATLSIPAEIDGMPVRAIADFVFSGRKDLRGSLTIPESVTSIGDGAFLDCSGLTGTLTIPAGLTVIGAEVFSGCSGLTGTLTIPEGVTDINYCAFFGCTGITRLVLPESLESIGDDAFNEMSSSLVAVVTSGSVAHQYCRTHGIALEVNAAVSDYAYETRTDDGGNAYIAITGYHGASDANLRIPAEIDGLPVREIADSAFAWSDELTGTLTIPEGVVRIGDYAFRGCYGLTGSLTIPGSVQSIGAYAFEGCSSLTGDLTILPGVVRIDSCAFVSCSGLTGTLSIPATVTSLATDAFQLCAFKNVDDQSGLYPTQHESGYLFVRGGTQDAPYAIITGYAGAMDAGLFIPARIEDLPVREIAAHAFRQLPGLTGGLMIPEGVTRIGTGAFAGCIGLTGELTIPSTVKRIEAGAFSYCEGLTGTLTIPEGVTSIGNEAFDGCAGFTTVVLPESLEYIGDCAFYSEMSSGPVAVVMENSYAHTRCLEMGIRVQVIRDAEVSDYDYQTLMGDDSEYIVITGYHGASDANLKIPAEIDGLPVREIGEDAFAWNDGLTGKLTIPQGVVCIGNYAFSGCNNLTGSLMIPNSVLSIGESAFSGCYGLTGSLTIPGSVLSIGNTAFYECSGLTGDLTIEPGVERIGNMAFADCSGLNGTLRIPASVTSLPTNAFRGCRFKEVIDQSGLYPKLAENGYYWAKGGTADAPYAIITGYAGKADAGLHIPAMIEGIPVQKIAGYAFSGRSELTGGVTIPEGVTSIEANAFSGCSGLTGDLTLPEGLKGIYYKAFYGCTGLTGTLTIPQSVEHIDEVAFYGCRFASVIDPTGLCPRTSPEGYCWKLYGKGENRYAAIFGYCGAEDAELTIPAQLGGVPVRAIEEDAFSGLDSLTGTLTIPEGVRWIGDWAFYGCSGITSVVLPASLNDIGYDAFSEMGSGLTIYVVDGSYAQGYFNDMGISTQVNPDAVISSYRYEVWADEDGTEYAAITGYVGPSAADPVIPAQIAGLPVRRIGRAAFEDNDLLTGTLTIPEGVTSIGDSAFAYCYNLTGSLTIPEGVTSIGASAFAYCSGMQGILTIPSTVTSLALDAFRGCAFSDVIDHSGLYPKTDDSGFMWARRGADDDAYAVITGYAGAQDAGLHIPAEIGGLPVRQIADRAFESQCNLTGSVTIPEGVTSIGASAFNGCSELTGDLTIPESVTKIGEHAFAVCMGLTGTLTIPESTTDIADYAFTGCRFARVNDATGLCPRTSWDGYYWRPRAAGDGRYAVILGYYGEGGSDLAIPSTLDGLPVREIEHHAFNWKEELTGTLTIPGTVTRIGQGAFWGCSGITRIVLPESLVHIGEDALYEMNSSLVAVVQEGSYAQQYCEDMGIDVWLVPDAEASNFLYDEMEDDDGTQYIVITGYEGPVNVNLTIPSEINGLPVWEIASSAFSCRDALTGKLTIPDSVKRIGDQAFYLCYGLTGSLKIPGSVQSIGRSAFEGCEGLTGNLTIESGVTSIGYSAFFGCSGMTGTLTIPATVTDMAANAFKACSFSKVIDESGLYPKQDESGFAWARRGTDDDAYAVITGYNGPTNMGLHIPAEIEGLPVRTIAGYAFSGRNDIQGSLTIPASVRSIEGSAFIRCEGLTGDLKIPEGVQDIWRYAFAGCIGLTGTLTIPSTVTSLADTAFFQCEFSEVVDHSGWYPKQHESGLVWNIQGTGEDRYAVILRYEGEAWQNPTIPAELDGVPVRSIERSAFDGNEQLTGTLTIPEGVTSIGSYAFWGCSGITRMELPASLTSIGEGALSEMSSDLVVVVVRGSYAQQYCEERGITIWMEPESEASDFIYGDVEYPDGTCYPVVCGYEGPYEANLVIPAEHDGQAIWGIADAAFEDHGWLTGKLKISYGIQNIGAYAFSNCSGLRGSLTIPGSVKRIDNAAFYGCSSLTGDLTIESGVTSIGYSAFAGCSGMTGTLRIPATVTEMATNAFQGCAFTKVIDESGLYPVQDESGFMWARRTEDGETYAVITGYNGPTDAGLSIPAEIEGLPVRVIATQAFSGRGDIRGSLTIPTSVRSIDGGAFSDCTGLTGDLTIPEGVEGIWSDAFAGCTGLTGTLTLPSTLVSMIESAFDGCTFAGVVDHSGLYPKQHESGLVWNIQGKGEDRHVVILRYEGPEWENPTVPSELGGLPVRRIGRDALGYNDNLKGTVTIPDGVTRIDEGAFVGSMGITRIVLPSSVTYIEEYAFICMNSSLVVVVPRNSYAHEYCVSNDIKVEVVQNADLDFLYEVRTADDGARYAAITGYNGPKSEELTIPARIVGLPVREIASHAFENSFMLSGVLTIPGSVTSIGDCAFYNCYNLSGVLTIPGSVTSIGDYAFYNCLNLSGNLTIPGSVQRIGNSAFKSSFYQAGTLTIEPGVESIGSRAFQGCGFQGDVIIPASVKSLATDAFLSCGVNVTGESDLCSKRTEDGFIWAKRGTQDDPYAVIVGYGGDGNPFLSLPEEIDGNPVRVIGAEAFGWQSHAAENLVIPAGVTSIEENAFFGCEGLTGDLTIPEGVTSIDSGAFRDCYNLNGTLTIPASVTSLSPNAFIGCGFENVVDNSELYPHMDAAGFRWRAYGTGEERYAEIVGFDGLTDDGLIIPASVEGVPVRRIADRAFAYRDDLWCTLTIPEGVTSIGDEAFMGCNWLSGDLTIPEGVTSIGHHAFSDCFSLDGNLTIPESVTSIGQNAFSYCSSLKGTPTLPNGLTSIEAGIFNFGVNLTGMPTIPSGVTTIGESAFQDCSNLTGTLIIPKGVTGIRNWAFSGCFGITKVVLPNSLTSIGDQAFDLMADGLVVVVEEDSAAHKFFKQKDNVTIQVIRYAKASDFRREVRTEDDGTQYIAIAGYEGASDANLTIPAEIDGLPVQEIAEGAFRNREDLTGKLTIPDSVRSIGDSAFAGCSGVTGSLTIPGGVTSIGNSAFAGCSGLTGSLTIPGSVRSIGMSAFDSCTGLTGDLTLEDGVESIGHVAFLGCTGLNGTLRIPKSVTSMQMDSFQDCRFADVVDESGLYPKESESGFIWVRRGTEGDLYAMITGYNGPTEAGLSIPAELEGLPVRSIAGGAFSGRSDLTGSVTIPSSVTSIGNAAFKDCTGLTGDLTIPDGVTSILRNTFAGCTGLTGTLTIPKSVTSIDGTAFTGCAFSRVIDYSELLPRKDENGLLWRACDLEGDPYVVIMGYEGATTDWLDIPELIERMPVRKIASGAFEGHTDLRGYVWIPNGVTEIGDRAFAGCAGFDNNMRLPINLTSMGVEAFAGCASMPEVLAIPGGLKGISAGTFANTGLKRVVVQPGVESIGSRAFAGSSMTFIMLPESIRSIADDAFAETPASLVATVVKDSYAHTRCQELGIQVALTGESAVSDYTYSTEVDESGASYAVITGYEGNPNNDLNIPAQIGDLPVRRIGSFAFNCREDLTGHVTIPEGVTYIDEYAFNECRNLTGGLTIPSSVTGIGECAFEWCVGLQGDLTLPEGLLTIREEAFYNCIGLSGTLTIPSSVTSVDNTAFKGCVFAAVNNGAPDVYCRTGDGYRWSVRGEEGEQYAEITGYDGPGTVQLNIPAELEGLPVKSIGQEAFDYCSGLYGTLSIPNSVTSIGARAFGDCQSLTGTLDFLDRLTDIGEGAFSGCMGLTGGLVIPDRMTSISANAFSGCSGLTGELVIPSGVTSIGDQAFSGCSGLTGELVIPDSVKNIGTYAFLDCSSLTGELVIPKGVTSIGNSAFSCCAGLTGVKIPENVTSIGSYVFYNCRGLNGELVIPSSVTSIGSYAFGNCSGLTGTLSIPEGLTTIEAGVFVGCSGLTGNLVIPEGVTGIGNNAFNGCSGLTGELVIPADVTSIGSYAFYNCAGLTGDLTIPDGVKTIGTSAFYSCSGLNGTLTIPASVTSIGSKAFTGCAFTQIDDNSGLYKN